MVGQFEIHTVIAVYATYISFIIPKWPCQWYRTSEYSKWLCCEYCKNQYKVFLLAKTYLITYLLADCLSTISEHFDINSRGAYFVCKRWNKLCSKTTTKSLIISINIPINWQLGKTPLRLSNNGCTWCSLCSILYVKCAK